MKIIPVMAENYNKFCAYLKENNLNKRHFAYISDPQQLRGYDGIVLCIGLWSQNVKYSNYDFWDLVTYLRYSGRVSFIKASWESEDILARKL